MNSRDLTTRRSRVMHAGSIFWDVDTQVDFMLPHGKLYAPGAERIISNLERLTQHARDHNLLVIASVDAHHPGDAEFAQWPEHCMAGTPGQRKIPETLLHRRHVVPNSPAQLPADFSRFQQVIVEKQAVDVFTNPNIERLLQGVGKPDVTLYGVVTEVCVAHAARGLLRRGYQVRVVSDAICALDQERGRALLDELRAAGAELVRTEDVVKVSKSHLA